MIAGNEQFVAEFASVQRFAFEVNCRNGWWDHRNEIMGCNIPNAVPIVVVSTLGLVGSEVAEAIEAVRKSPIETWGDVDTKDTLVRELAGTVVRCMDLAERLNLDLGIAILNEIKANAARGVRHGGNAT